MLYEFELCLNATEATKNIYCAKDDVTVDPNMIINVISIGDTITSTIGQAQVGQNRGD